MSKLVNGQNDFNEASLAEMKERLERGETIRIHIDCIGHTRTAIVTSLYADALREAYGERLVIEGESGVNAEYSLKASQGL